MDINNHAYHGINQAFVCPYLQFHCIEKPPIFATADQVTTVI